MRQTVRRVATLVVAWVAGVALIGSLTYVVVDLVGQVVAADPSTTRPGAAARASGPTAATGTDRSGRPSSGEDPTTSGPGGESSTDPTRGTPDRSGAGTGGSSMPRSTATSPGDRPGTTGPGTTGPGATAPPRPNGTTRPSSPPTSRADPTSTPPSATPDPPPTTSPPQPPTKPTSKRTGSFTTDAGTAVVSCSGRVVHTESITVRDGWSFGDRTAPSQGEVTVTFTHTSDGAVVEIEVSCVRGRPERTGGRTDPGHGKKGSAGDGSTDVAPATSPDRSSSAGGRG